MASRGGEEVEEKEEVVEGWGEVGEKAGRREEGMDGRGAQTIGSTR